VKGLNCCCLEDEYLFWTIKMFTMFSTWKEHEQKHNGYNSDSLDLINKKKSKRTTENKHLLPYSFQRPL
jgi:hypothetical protein